MLEPAETSYFSEPSAGLDPRLFKDGKFNSGVRSAILQLLFNHLNDRYTGADGWTTVWLAGSGVSYQWAAHRDPGDLDCLIGINFPAFRQSNSSYARLSDKEISEMLNEGFRSDLHPRTGEFMNSFELTFYVNVKSNIVDIKPYAAYSLTDDSWTVPPTMAGAPENPEWDRSADLDRQQAIDILTRYLSAKARFESATNQGIKTNAQTEMRQAMNKAASLYDEIHLNRSSAFSAQGEGYGDYANYRWQSGKKTGVIQALRSVRAEMKMQEEEFNAKTYGGQLSDSRTLIRRAASQYL